MVRLIPHNVIAKVYSRNSIRWCIQRQRKHWSFLDWQWCVLFFVDALRRVVNLYCIYTGLAVLSAIITLLFIKPLTNDGMIEEDIKVLELILT